MSDSTQVTGTEDVSRSPQLMAIVYVLNILAFAVYGLRMYTRATPSPHFGLDDHLMTAAMVCALVTWIIITWGIESGLGRHQQFLDPQDIMNAIKWSFIEFFPQTWAICFIRCSVACMLLRFRHDLPWRILLYTLIGLQVATAILNTITVSISAIPLEAVWNPSVAPNAWRLDRRVSVLIVQVGSVIGILTDLIFSLMPVVFIRNIERPLREKIVLASLMGMGVFVTGASTAKIILINEYNTPGDTTWYAFDPIVWCLVEQVFATVAACVPTLKALMEKCLKRMGLTSSARAARTRSRGYGGGIRSHTYRLHSSSGKAAEQSAPRRAVHEDWELKSIGEGYGATGSGAGSEEAIVGLGREEAVVAP